MIVKTSIIPIRDNHNSYPPSVDFIIYAGSVEIIADSRVLEFSISDFRRLAALIAAATSEEEES